MLRQVCGALDEAHALGLIHRDVKPGNIMLCLLSGRPDAAKLLDFGIVAETSRSDTRITQVGGQLGTPAYMSPEQARGAIDVGPASDLYSLGAVAYFLLSGRTPSVDSNPPDPAQSQVTIPVRPPSVYNSAIAPDLEAVILRLLAPATRDRYSSAADVGLALAACGAAADWTEKDAAQWWERASMPDRESPQR